MDRPFNVTQWQPTQPPEPGEEDPTDELPALRAVLNAETRLIYRHPYDPENWLQRARTLARLRFPELAVGDAWKAVLLCRVLLARLQEDEGRWRLGAGMGFWMLAEDGAGEIVDAGGDSVGGDDVDDLEQRIMDVQYEAHGVEMRNLYHYPRSEEGRYLPRPYPWMEARHRVRDEELRATLNEEFAAQAANIGHQVTDCCVRRHAFGHEGKDGSDVFGVFATRNLPEDTRIVVDKTRTWGCIGPGVNGSTHNLNGGLGCMDPLHPNLDTEDTTQDLRWIRDRAGDRAAEVILRCRLLLCGIEDGVEHPLDHSLLARLTPTYRRERVCLFMLKEHIVIPNEFLQQFGVDIFADPKYDTWVLFTVMARELNNSWSDPVHSCISPLFSLFNHSCAPNVSWTSHGKDQTSIEMRTKCDVRQGEQLFVQYDTYVSEHSVEERRIRMRKWLDADCECKRCVREAAGEEGKGKGRDTPDSGVEMGGEWDTAVKPVFPEDALRPTFRGLDADG